MKSNWLLRWSSLALALATLLCVSAFGNVPAACASGPGEAAGTALATYSISSAGWSKGALEILEETGNYSSSGLTYPYIRSLVQVGGAVKSRNGSITYRQNFVWTGGGAAGDIGYSTTIKAFAAISAALQTAYGKSRSGFDFGGGSSYNTVEASAPTSDPDEPQYDEDIHTATVQITNTTHVTTWSETATVTARATTP